MNKIISLCFVIVWKFCVSFVKQNTRNTCFWKFEVAAIYITEMFMVLIVFLFYFLNVFMNTNMLEFLHLQCKYLLYSLIMNPAIKNFIYIPI